jgi:hypothetical protein
MDIRRTTMRARPLARIAILVLAVALVTLSCTFDYWLDFAISDWEVNPADDHQVIVGYSMINRGDRDMNNASIYVQVTAKLMDDTPEQCSEWLPIAGVDLAGYGDSFSGTYTFLFSGTINPATVEVEILGSRWDEYTSSY